MSTSNVEMIPHKRERAHIHGDSCSPPKPNAGRTIKRLQVITICWMLVECSVALTAAWRAHSPALLAFGSDSSVELLSALIVLLQFTAAFKISPDRAARIAGVLLFLLAGIVTMISIQLLFSKFNPIQAR